MPDLMDIHRRLVAVAFAPAVTRALNRAALSARTAMVRAVAADLGAATKPVSGYIRVENATADSQRARVYPLGKHGIPLIKLGAKGPEPSRGKGSVSVQVAIASKRYLFISTMPKSGHRGVFQRRGKARLPIDEVRTRPIPAVFRDVKNVGDARAREALTTNLQSELRYALSRLTA